MKHQLKTMVVGGVLLSTLSTLGQTQGIDRQEVRESGGRLARRPVQELIILEKVTSPSAANHRQGGVYETCQLTNSGKLTVSVTSYASIDGEETPLEVSSTREVKTDGLSRVIDLLIQSPVTRNPRSWSDSHATVIYTAYGEKIASPFPRPPVRGKRVDLKTVSNKEVVLIHTSQHAQHLIRLLDAICK